MGNVEKDMNTLVQCIDYLRQLIDEANPEVYLFCNAFLCGLHLYGCSKYHKAFYHRGRAA
jgi:hypothetical protein